MDVPNLPVTLVYVLISFILVTLNAFFVASEFAIVKVRRTRLEELANQGVRSAKNSILCVDRLDEYLSATQLGITLASLALGWIGAESFFSLFQVLFPGVLAPGRNGTAHFIAAGLSFSTITLLHVVMGELVPKSMAIQRAERFALWVAGPLLIFDRAARPLIRAFSGLANLVLHRLGFHGLEEPPLSEEELKLVMKDSHEEGVISESEAQIINRAFSFADKRVSDIMIPADKVEYLSLSRSFEENMAVTRRRMHTRFPLTRDELDTVLGVVHVKDLVHFLGEMRSNAVFEKVLRPATYVDAGTPEDRLMRLLGDRRAHLAIVRDPRSRKTIGIVTMEDILEELVGDIRDEYGN